MPTPNSKNSLSGEQLVAIAKGSLELFDNDLKPLIEEFRCSVRDCVDLDPEKAKEIFDGIESDHDKLPKTEGDVIAPEEEFTKIEALCETFTMREIADKLLAHVESNGSDTVCKKYNAVGTYHPERADIVWNGFMGDPGIKSMLEKIGKKLAESVEGDDVFDKAMEAIKNIMTAQPQVIINSKTEALLLLSAIRAGIGKHVRNRLKEQAMNGVPVFDESTEIDPELFVRSFEVGEQFAKMDEIGYKAMLRNDLGQAMTADYGKAESYFRSLDVASDGKERPNNFSYVYLDKKQTEDFGLSDTNYARPFTYSGEQYFAVPVGAFFDYASGDFDRAMNNLSELAESYPYSPAETYYESLRDFYSFAQTQFDGANGKDFVKDYFELCYQVERNWVAYAAYVSKNGLPLLHIHPFENYDTASTKTHDLALGVVNPKETKVYLDEKETHIQNTERFMGEAGIAQKYPEMHESTMKNLESLSLFSFAARMNTRGRMIAQVIPNEPQGREDGVVTLFDTALAFEYMKSSGVNSVKKKDPVGGYAEIYERNISDFKTFLDHFVFEIASHELAHNYFKGQDQSFKGDGKGFPIKMIEESKATAGSAMYFEDPYNLKEDELADLKKMFPLCIIWSIGRISAPSRKAHESDQYLPEGAVQLDHLIKSGILTAIGFTIDPDGNPVESPLDKSDFEFFQVDVSDDEKLKDYVRMNADYIKKLAPLYKETQHNPDLDSDTVVPDIQSVDAYQALKRKCIQEDIDKCEDEVKKAQLIEQRDKLTEPSHPGMPEIIDALCRYADIEQPGRLKSALAKATGLSEDSPELEKKLQELQDKLKADYPQVIE